MPIDYDKVVLKSLGPKLAYFGFKYDDEKSHPPPGIYQFTRHYWGAPQSIIISRVKYVEEDLAAAAVDGDTVCEVPSGSLLLKEPGYRSWLSNKYISALVCHDGACVNIRPDGKGIGLSFVKAQVSGGRALRKKAVGSWNRPEWWEFNNRGTLTLRLKEIYERIINDGLDWFERQVAGVRRYHDKLDARRIAVTKKRRATGAD